MAVEAQVVVERSRDNTMGKKRELLSVNDMIERKWPDEKIKAIVARGGESLMRTVRRLSLV